MFQSIYSLVADFYNISENLALMLGQISLILLAIVLLPYAFLSDFVAVRTVVITSSMMVAFGSTLKTLARDLSAEGDSYINKDKTLFFGLSRFLRY